MGGVNIIGGNARQIRVQVDPAAMHAYGLSPAQLTAALQRENQEVPAGRIEGGVTERLVRVTGRIVDPKSFADIPVAVRGGTPVRIGDVATVVDGAENRRTAAEIFSDTASAPAVSLEVLKISGSNTVEVADAVKAMVTELEKQLPQDIRMTIIRDDSRRIRESLADVQLTIVLGAILTVMIIYLFLNSWRSTVITGLTLPISIISAFFVMWVFDFTVNTMTLLALSLAIGLLIDDAIVVRENIVRHLEMGKSHDDAAREGTSEIGLAVISTSFAVVAVFIPVAFMGGMIGKIFFQFGVTVAFAVLVSLFVSFTLDPMLSSKWADPEVEHAVNDGGVHMAEQRRHANPIRRVAFAFNDRFERLADHYPRWLGWALGHRLIVLATAAATIILSFVIIPRLGFTWMPDVNGDEFTVSYRTPPGSRLEYTLDKGRDIATFLMKQPEIDFTYLSVGGGFRGTPNQGSIFVALRHGHERSLAEIQTDLRGKLRGIAGVRPTIQGQRTIFGGFRQPIIVNVQGPEASRLKLAAARTLDAIKSVPGVAEPNSSEDGDIPQLDVRVDRQEAWRAGLGVGSVASTLQPLFSGQRATTWEDPQGFSHDVVVIFPDSLRSSAENVSSIPVASTFIDARSGLPSMVPLSQVAEVRAGVGPQQIERRMLEQQVQLATGVLPGYAMGDVADRVKRAIETIGLPPGYHAVFTGDVQNLEETKGYVLERAAPRGGLHLPDPRVALRLLPPAAGDHDRPAAELHRRRPGAPAHPRQHERDDDDRDHHAHGAGDEERHSARGLHEPAPGRGGGARRGAARGGTDPAPPDHHDHRGDDLRHDAAGAGHRRGSRGARADGARGHRGPDHLHPPHPVRRAGDVHLPRRPRELGERAAHRRAARCAGRRGRRRTDPGAGDGRLIRGAYPRETRQLRGICLTDSAHCLTSSLCASGPHVVTVVAVADDGSRRAWARGGAHVVQRRRADRAATSSWYAGPTVLSLQEAVMPRGDELNESLRFSDRDDDSDDLGYGGGGGGSSSYDDDDEEDGGWTTHKDDSDDLWDSTDDSDEEEEEGGLGTPVVEGEEDEEESPLVVARAPRSGGSGRPLTGGSPTGGARPPAGGAAAGRPVTPSRHPAIAEPAKGTSVNRGSAFTGAPSGGGAGTVGGAGGRGPSATKSAAKSGAAKKGAGGAGKPAGKTSSAKKAVAKKSPMKKAAKKSPMKKAAGKKSPAKKAAGKRAPMKKAAGKKSPMKKAAAKKAAAKKSPARKGGAKKSAKKSAKRGGRR